MGRCSPRLTTYAAEALRPPGNCCSTVTSPSWASGSTQLGDMPRVTWLAVGGVNADEAQVLLDNLNRATTAPTGLTGIFAPAVSTTAVATPLAPVLSAFVQTQAAVQSVLLLLFVSLIVVGAAVILLAAGMIAGRRADDLGLLRSRGASVRQVATVMLRSTAIVAGLAALSQAAPGHSRYVRQLVIDRLTPQQLDQLAEISAAILDNLQHDQQAGDEP